MSIIPVHDDRILQYVYPLVNKPCPGVCGSPKSMNPRAHEVSDTYWCPYCYVDKYFTLIDLTPFGEHRLPHIKQVVKQFLAEHRGYFTNIHY